MHLAEALNACWEHQPEPPQTHLEALQRLHGTVRDCLRNFEQGHAVRSQEQLEASLVATLVAIRCFGLDPDRAIVRALSRQAWLQTRSQGTFHLLPDRVEIWVCGELRGGWPVFSPEDYQTAYRLARELDCSVLSGEDAVSQLSLFAAPIPAADKAQADSHPDLQDTLPA
jgi:hypothetical protein